MKMQERFWAKVRRTDGCWEWTGSVKCAERPYGRFGLNGRMRPAHRVSWEIANGPIPNEMHVLHKCDNPRCVRPDHLFLGTHTDNMRDMTSKNRRRCISGEEWWRAHPHMKTGKQHHWSVSPTPTPRGEENHMAILTEPQVRHIKSRIRETNGRRGICTELAREYGVNPDTVRKIKAGRNWSHVA